MIAVERMRDELQRMYAAGSTLADMESYMSDQAMRGEGHGLVWSAYLATDKPSVWLEDFLNG